MGETLLAATVWMIGWMYTCAKHKATVDNVNRLDGITKFTPGFEVIAWICLMVFWPFYLGHVSDDGNLTDDEILTLNKAKWKSKNRPPVDASAGGGVMVEEEGEVDERRR